MAYRSRPQPLEAPSPAEQRSGLAFAAMLGLAMLAISFPQLAPQALQGLLWTGAGLLMIALPPEQRLPRTWIALALGFLLASALGFLPREWFGVPGWRSDLEALGLGTGTRSYVQPWLAAEAWAGFAATALAVLFLLGHRVNTAIHLRLALGFVLATGLWVAVALWSHDAGEVFGFFPNRNHTATLLAMGTLAGIGVLSQAIRLKEPGWIGLAVAPVLLCLYALLAVSESRAGLVLAATGLIGWLAVTGFRAFRGHVGKAILLVGLASIGAFAITDSRVKERLAETMERLQPPAGGTFADTATGQTTDPPFDARIAIFRDTADLIAAEPWSGVGPGQFSRVFPQHRLRTQADNNAICLHPESDWLLMLAETGWAAFTCLAGAAGLAFAAAFTRLRGGRARLLRAGTLVAAGLLCFHGVFDVPGHRIGLAWAAAFLLAISMRPEGTPDPRPAPIGRGLWRFSGGLLLVAGIFLLHAQWTGQPLLSTARVLSHMTAATALYEADQAAYEQATAAGREHQPPDGEDPLEAALAQVDEALRLAPLDPHLHGVRAALALHFDDKQAIAEAAHALQRRLVPGRVAIPLEQAKAWSLQDPQRSRALWEEALRRARIEDSRLPGSHFGVGNTFREIIRAAAATDPAAALELAGESPDLLDAWIRATPAATLNRELPRRLPALATAEARLAAWNAWKTRADPAVVREFLRSHPELGLPAS